MVTKPRRQSTRIRIIETEVVPLKTLRTYEKNPRVGNVDAIAKSLHINGQYKPIVVNRGTKWKDGKNVILAGNHTYLGARKEISWSSRNRKTRAKTSYTKPVWDDIVVSWVDVDEERAKAIILADNKTADLGTYEERLLAELMEDVPDISGTGYTEEEADEITKMVERATSDTQRALDELDDDSSDVVEGLEGNVDRRTTDNVDFGEENEASDPDDEIDTAAETLEGAFQLQDDIQFEGWGRWEIPKFRTDMLMRPEELPDKLSAWAGSASRDTPENEDPDHWWLYNYGIDSTSGMNYRKNMILSFYAWDEYFEKFYHFPAKMTTKALRTGVKYAVTPNFSCWTDVPNFFNLEALFKQRYMGRYFQEAGIKIIPDIEWPRDDGWFLENFVLKSLPKRLPVIALQGNSVIDVEARGEEAERQTKLVSEQYNQVIDTLKPEVLLYYGSPKWIAHVKGLKFKCDVVYIQNRNVALGEKAKKREKNVGL